MLTQHQRTLQQTQVFIHNYAAKYTINYLLEHPRTASGPRTRHVDILATVITVTA